MSTPPTPQSLRRRRPDQHQRPEAENRTQLPPWERQLPKTRRSPRRPPHPRAARASPCASRCERRRPLSLRDRTDSARTRPFAVRSCAARLRCSGSTSPSSRRLRRCNRRGTWDHPPPVPEYRRSAASAADSVGGKDAPRFLRRASSSQNPCKESARHPRGPRSPGRPRNGAAS